MAPDDPNDSNKPEDGNRFTAGARKLVDKVRDRFARKPDATAEASPPPDPESQPSQADLDELDADPLADRFAALEAKLREQERNKP